MTVEREARAAKRPWSNSATDWISITFQDVTGPPDVILSRQEAFVPLSHAPGHAQVDFGEALGVIGFGRRNFLVATPRFDSFNDPNAWLAQQCLRRQEITYVHGDKSLEDLIVVANPRIRGWINDFGSFCRTALCSTLKRIDLHVIRWARRKFKRLRRTAPTLFAH